MFFIIAWFIFFGYICHLMFLRQKQYLVALYHYCRARKC